MSTVKTCIYSCKVHLFRQIVGYKYDVWLIYETVHNLSSDLINIQKCI